MEVPEGCGEAKMGRNKTMGKLKKQDEKQERIKNNKKSELGVKGVKVEPTSIEETFFLKHVTRERCR